MLVDIVDVRALGGTRLHLRFDNGVEGEVDIAEMVRFDGVFAALRQAEEFARVQVDSDIGTIRWPNGADMDPNVLYSRITGAPLPGQIG